MSATHCIFWHVIAWVSGYGSMSRILHDFGNLSVHHSREKVIIQGMGCHSRSGLSFME